MLYYNGIPEQLIFSSQCWYAPCNETTSPHLSSSPLHPTPPHLSIPFLPPLLFARIRARAAKGLILVVETQCLGDTMSWTVLVGVVYEFLGFTSKYTDC